MYSPGRELNSIGVFGQSMNLICETLFIRLAYCLSNKEKFDDLWDSNLEGFDLVSFDVEEEN